MVGSGNYDCVNVFIHLVEHDAVVAIARDKRHFFIEFGSPIVVNIAKSCDSYFRCVPKIVHSLAADTSNANERDIQFFIRPFLFAYTPTWQKHQTAHHCGSFDEISACNHCYLLTNIS